MPNRIPWIIWPCTPLKFKVNHQKKLIAIWFSRYRFTVLWSHNRFEDVSSLSFLPLPVDNLPRFSRVLLLRSRHDLATALLSPGRLSIDMIWSWRFPNSITWLRMISHGLVWKFTGKNDGWSAHYYLNCQFGIPCCWTSPHIVRLSSRYCAWNPRFLRLLWSGKPGRNIQSLICLSIQIQELNSGSEIPSGYST